MNDAPTSLRVVNNLSAMVAYWNADLECVFCNDAYCEWFGRTPREMAGISVREFLGPAYEQVWPHIQGALNGRQQVFERQISTPAGEVRDTIATYTPDLVDGVVRGITVHIADVTSLRQREAELRHTIRERDEALAELRTVRSLLPICAGCKSIRDEEGSWHSIESYLSERTGASMTHSLCPTCMEKYYPGILPHAPLPAQPAHSPSPPTLIHVC